MNELLWCGLGFVVLAGAAAVVAGVMYFRRNTDKWRGIVAYLAGYRSTPTAMGMPEEPLAAALPSDSLPAGADATDQLKVVKAKQTVTLLGDREREVKAAITLWEMTQARKNAPWTKTGLKSRALFLAGGVWILKVPGREGGRPVWLKAEEVETMPLGRFYKGGDTPDTWGPARQFKENGQTQFVPYKLPAGLTPRVIWQVADIGTFDAEVDGTCDNAANGDRLYFVTSREQKGARWLLYLDARKGEAQGSGGLLLCTPFEPTVDMEGML